MKVETPFSISPFRVKFSEKWYHMSTSVTNNTPVLPTRAASQVTSPLPVPAGVGAAATTIEQAAISGESPMEKGCIERSVLTIRDWVIWFFESLCFCFKKGGEESPASGAQRIPPEQQLLNQLLRTTRGEEVLHAFDTHLSDSEKLSTLQEIGKRSGTWLTCRPFDVIGRDMAISNPELLLPNVLRALQRKIENS